MVHIACRGDKSSKSDHMGYEASLLRILAHQFSYALCWLNFILLISHLPGS